ncbi:MAG: hypothetical protein RMI45_05190 [Ignisphaera sp.]|nr:hypothetical protein [Ignisphaera sp.]MDW8085614.1 hypothetical protein [Ignisphaera sp.]
MDSATEGASCSRCVYFKPHIYFPYVGYCVIKQGTAVHQELTVCESFKPSSVDELRGFLRREGWLYCVNCRRFIYTEVELEEHARQHLVSPGVVLDEAIAEEAHAGD